MQTLMHLVWLVIVISNITLSLLLIIRGLYVKFSWLTLSCILSVFADYTLGFLRSHHPAMHTNARNLVFFLFLSLEWMIVFEAWKWGKKWVQIPMEIMIGLQILGVLLHYAGALWTAYYLDCIVGVYNLGLTVFFIAMFDKERTNE